MKSGLEVLLGVGGGIAAFKVAALASQLVQDGCSVRVAMTGRAQEFVGAVTFEGLTGRKAILSPTQVDLDGSVPHIDAARAASIYVIAPASSDLLAKLAAGVADDPVSLLAITCRAPVLVCPAMNDNMWKSDVVGQNVAALRDRGFQFAGPVTGHLAEGYDAVGRMVEPHEIVEQIERLVGG